MQREKRLMLSVPPFTFSFDFQINFELRKMADSKGPDEERFNQLATSVEQYTSCLLDPLRADKHRREELGDALDDILDKAIELEQKQVTLKQTGQSHLVSSLQGVTFRI